MYKTIVYCAS